MALTKSDVVRVVAVRSGLSLSETEAFLNALQEVLMESLARGHAVEIAGLMSFERVTRERLVGRNPRTGEEIVVPPGYGVKVTAGHLLRNAAQQTEWQPQRGITSEQNDSIPVGPISPPASIRGTKSAATITQRTQDVHVDLKAELAYLQGPRRRAIRDRIAAARDKGNLGGNVQYLAARGEQADNEALIAELTKKMGTLQVSPPPDSVVEPGMLFTVAIADEETIFALGSGEMSSTVTVEVYSAESPFGKAIQGHSKGDTVDYIAPLGRKITAKIKDVEPFANPSTVADPSMSGRADERLWSAIVASHPNRVRVGTRGHHPRVPTGPGCLYMVTKDAGQVCAVLAPGYREAWDYIGAREAVVSSRRLAMWVPGDHETILRTSPMLKNRLVTNVLRRGRPLEARSAGELRSKAEPVAGIYRLHWLDETGSEVIYIGRTADLRRRPGYGHEKLNGRDWGAEPGNITLVELLPVKRLGETTAYTSVGLDDAEQLHVERARQRHRQEGKYPGGVENKTYGRNGRPSHPPLHLFVTAFSQTGLDEPGSDVVPL